MSVALPGDDAASMERFFQAFEQRSEESAAGLGAFFQQFDSAYARARGARAATTPHLDVLRIFRLEYRELPHSDALKWFLDPEAEHEQGGLFATELLRHFVPGFPPISNYKVARELVGTHGRTDIGFYAPGEFVVFIENKVRAGERENQIRDMVRDLLEFSEALKVPENRQFALFLSDQGSEPTTAADLPPRFLRDNLRSVSRVDLIQRFRSALNTVPVASQLLLNFVDSYLAAIRRLLLGI